MTTTKSGRRAGQKGGPKSGLKSGPKGGSSWGPFKGQRISPCLWFANEAEEAARFYTSIFKNSRITGITRYSSAGSEIHGQPAGSVMLVAFELDGQTFAALNGGPVFKFNEAVSLQINCDTQEEIDYYWEKLTAGGDPKAQQCGWLKDKYGLSWQVTPNMEEFFKQDANSPGAKRAMEAMLRMKKIDMAELQRAYEGAQAR
jgi:predicted 3-demethylubiquinone-9 3-methyltransferase (glyoxalase superfamily)